MSVTRRLLSVALAPVIFAVIGVWACYAAAGPSLGLFLGGLIVVTLLVPPLTLAETSTANRLIALSAVVGPLCLFCLLGTSRADVWFREWVAASSVMLAYTAALAGLSAALRLVTRSAVASAAVTVIVGLAWMSWPIWASRTWSGGESEVAVARAVVCHPALTVNGQISRGLGNWTEQSLAYHLTELAQSVNFVLPQTVWPCVLLHGSIGAALLALTGWGERRASTETSVSDTSNGASAPTEPSTEPNG